MLEGKILLYKSSEQQNHYSNSFPSCHVTLFSTESKDKGNTYYKTTVKVPINRKRYSKSALIFHVSVFCRRNLYQKTRENFSHDLS